MISIPPAAHPDLSKFQHERAYGKLEANLYIYKFTINFHFFKCYVESSVLLGYFMLPCSCMKRGKYYVAWPAKNTRSRIVHCNETKALSLKYQSEFFCDCYDSHD